MHDVINSNVKAPSEKVTSKQTTLLSAGQKHRGGMFQKHGFSGLCQNHQGALMSSQEQPGSPEILILKCLYGSSPQIATEQQTGCSGSEMVRSSNGEQMTHMLWIRGSCHRGI